MLNVIPTDDPRFPTYSELEVCRRCGGLYGPLLLADPPLCDTQRCPCEPGPVAPEVWAEFDFNQAVELCYCCGQVLLRSGTTHTLWFCPWCNDLVSTFNRRVNRYAIPLSRHRIWGGPQLPGDATDVDVQIFHTAWEHISIAMRSVRVWAALNIARIIEGRFREWVGDVPLSLYVTECRNTQEERRLRFELMLRYLTGVEVAR